MKKITKVLANFSLFFVTPFVADAAGTYYTGNYQSPQAKYSQQSYAQRARTTNYSGNYSSQGVSAYNRNQYANSGYDTTNRVSQQNNNIQPVKQQSVKPQTGRQGFYLDAGISRQMAMWQFEMKNAGSILHYDNIDWSVLDVNAGYVFNAGNTPMQITAGFEYGVQATESTMVDDDITNGGFLVIDWNECLEYDDGGNCIKSQLLGNQVGHAMSIGTAKDGSMFGVNGAFGLTDFFKWGRAKITPSIGWRYFKYSLETHANHGLSIDTYDGVGGCVSTDGELECDPLLIFYNVNDKDEVVDKSIAVRVDTNGNGLIDFNDDIQVPNGYKYVAVGNSYYFTQDAISHKYDVEWSGPYFALDMLYDINQNNKVNARIELGLPSYTATGDQPYRFDWAHPKSVEDKAGIGDAVHLGLGATWSTAITDFVAFSIGLTYDYYTVSGADAKTYFNEDHYMGIYNELLALYQADGFDEQYMIENDAIAQNILLLKQECPGWVCSEDGEIESFYKSLGIRVGINAKF